MPGPSWSDVQRRGLASDSPATRAAVPPAAPPATPPAGALPGPLGRLLAERQELERRMERLTGGADAADPRLAALYQVRPLAERRAEHAAWDARRQDAISRSAASTAARRREDEEAATARRAAPDAGAPPLRETPGERLRREPGGTPVDPEAFAAVRDRVADFRRSLREADRVLGEQPGGGGSRDSRLDRLLSGTDRLERVMDRASTIADAPRRAGRVIEEEWVRRRDAIGGADLERYERGFRERASRLFGVDTGSIEQLQERMDRQRSRLSARRRAARREEEGDQERRTRALERRRERANG